MTEQTPITYIGILERINGVWRLKWKNSKLIVERNEKIRIFDENGFKAGTFELKNDIEIPSEALRKSEY
ncbi:hypothetical protein AKJ41_05945 [candidate division MSBL1 archaeon SCGC-AAA259O05]|uniref:Uncharacterized protein n=1 Tax=candidate division MSBL1 archaeon SCGC-AAA259O05 TaxID=1698271 RepID=A0A133UY53_9EURY|nr:hypothetical protein AKJ41_05945 [candidate division MSBL1 archaeon SCGC-AAA259O05]